MLPVIRPSLFRPFLHPCRLLSSTHAPWSGHNKWSKIKQRKGIEDAKKSATYGKASRDIFVAVRCGGSPDPDKNNVLAAALQKARMNGVPKDTIEAALSRATRDKEAGDHHLTFEALAAKGSVGLVIECLTDNQNRTLHNARTPQSYPNQVDLTTPQIREILTRCSAYHAPVGFMFDRKGSVRVSLPTTDEAEKLELVVDNALQATAEDFNEVERSDDTLELMFTCPPHQLATLTSALISPEASHKVLASELVYIPKAVMKAPVDDDMRSQVSRLVEQLEADPDCLRVWTTLD